MTTSTTTTTAAGGTAIDLRSVASTAVTASQTSYGSAPNLSSWAYMTGTFPTGTAGTGWYQTSWIGNTTGSGTWIAWDLGATYTVSSMHVWNYNETGHLPRGIASFTLQTSTNGVAWTNAQAVDWSNTNLYQGSGATSYAGFDYNAFTSVTTRYIRFNNTQNYGGGETLTALGEIVFYGFMVGLPSPWATQDIGTVGKTGRACA